MPIIPGNPTDIPIIKAPKGMFRMIRTACANKGLDYNSLEQAQTARKILAKHPDTKKHTLIIYNDAGEIVGS